MMSELEFQNHLHGRHFHQLRKNIRDSLRYLYDNPKITYSQLMIAVCKAKYESEEASVKEGMKVKNLTETERITQQEEITKIQSNWKTSGMAKVGLSGGATG